ncbi:MAG: ABC transporter ATP-binding protein [bacterium]
MSTPLHAGFAKQYANLPPIRGDFAPSSALITVLYGPSGCGKSTVLRCLAGLERPSSGSIHFAGRMWFDEVSGTALPPQQRGVGFLFQDYALFPHMTVVDNIGYALVHRPAKERRRRVDELIERFRLAGLERHMPDQISGGQQQRVALARSLAGDPVLLLLDEPLSAVDTFLRETLRAELRSLLCQIAKPVIMVTHDWREVQALADEVILMDQGRPLQRGLPSAVFDRPLTVSAARMVGVDTILPVRACDREGGGTGVEVDGVRLATATPSVPGGSLSIGIRAEEVRLRRPGHEASATDGLRGRLVSVQSCGLNDYLQVDCGFPVTAVMTRRERAALELQAGNEVIVTIRPEAVLLLRRV